MKRQWLIEKHSSEDEDCAWDEYALGIVEDGYFRTIARFEDESDALWFRSAAEWQELLEDGIMPASPVPAIKPRTKVKTGARK